VTDDDVLGAQELIVGPNLSGADPAGAAPSDAKVDQPPLGFLVEM
jgi:hypothetical protein